MNNQLNISLDDVTKIYCYLMKLEPNPTNISNAYDKLGDYLKKIVER